MIEFKHIFDHVVSLSGRHYYRCQIGDDKSMKEDSTWQVVELKFSKEMKEDDVKKYIETNILPQYNLTNDAKIKIIDADIEQLNTQKAMIDEQIAAKNNEKSALTPKG